MTKQRPKHRPKKGRRTLNTPKDFSARDKVNATLKKELVNELLTTGKTPLVLIELSVNELRDLKPCLVHLSNVWVVNHNPSKYERHNKVFYDNILYRWVADNIVEFCNLNHEKCTDNVRKSTIKWSFLKMTKLKVLFHNNLINIVVKSTILS